MKFLKSLGDGIGTAAGVAWPTFGIVYGSLGLTHGVTTKAIALASLAGFLFIAILLPVSIWSYKNNQLEKIELQRSASEESEKIVEALLDYLYLTFLRLRHFANIDELTSISSLMQYLKMTVYADLNKNNVSVNSRVMLNNILNQDDFIFNFIRRVNIKILQNKTPVQKFENCVSNGRYNSFKQDVINIVKQSYDVNENRPSTTKYLKHGIFSFFSAFGSIAGCSAGVFGLLTSLGIFAGFSAIPVAGWSLLFSAIVFGIVVAGITIYMANDKCKYKSMHRHYKELHDEFDKHQMRTHIIVETLLNEKSKKVGSHTLLSYQNKIARGI